MADGDSAGGASGGIAGGVGEGEKRETGGDGLLSGGGVGWGEGVLVEAEEPNLKITVPADWVLAESWLKTRGK